MATFRLEVTVRDLRRDDLPGCGWAGGPGHLGFVTVALRRAELGEVEYLAVCPPTDLPLAIGGVDYTRRPGAGTLWQLAVHPAVRSCGLGTLLIGAAERRIAERGHDRAELSVAEDNPRARALYERLGYLAYGREPEEWNVVTPDGTVTRHRATCVLMRKPLH
ncbi:GNAT family N-acetyltransferase [Amycolatopsis antarctica]|uniref:GNAT family N-acetyltransferase n=1 Tax=Amycolatopsis antarctica TaxID=1854586 RepID=A0A263CVP1_9PSEU|nr:GNAT family N-acetyltransferase [Amycolatopsis antarctica]OZM70193.1 GNAT family N-acetyltransferase [Amycolatopsis antarctica]